MILFINCCVREESRTERLSRAVLESLGDKITELKLYDMSLKPLDRQTLEKRTLLTEKGDFSDKMFDLSKQFAASDTVVIAAPYWDLSFPSVLKLYLENIYVTGIVSSYTKDGKPHGLCRAKALYYITTSGGPYDPRFSYGYIEDMAKNYFGIPQTFLIKAEMLDIEENNAEAIIDQRIKEWRNTHQS